MSDQSTASNPTLHVVFAGLCMLVRDEKNQQLHVLLPTDHEHAGDEPGNERHEACLIHDLAYGATGTVTGQMSKLDLDGVVLDVRAVGGEKPAKLKVDDVVDERCMGGSPVQQEYLTAAIPAELVKSRISLATGQEGRKHRGAKWKLGQCEERMAIYLEWVIRPKLKDGKVEVTMHRRGSVSTLQLTPPADGHIYLYVLHVPANHVPETVPEFPFEVSPWYGNEAKHFRAFYPLIGRSAHDQGPTYVGPAPDSPSQPDDPSNERRLILGFDYGCMMATAPAA